MKTQLIASLAAVFAAGLIPVAPVSAQVKEQTEILTARDGWPVHISYYRSPMGKEAPIVVLVHGKGENRLVWKARKTVDVLTKDQFAVITVDLRKHGESLAPEDAPAAAKSSRLTRVDYAAMVAADLEAVKKFIFDEHQQQRLNMRKLGIVAADASAVIAINWAAQDWAKKPYDDAPTLAARTPRGQDVQAILVLSPADNVTGQNLTRSVPFLRSAGIAWMFLYGRNSTDKRIASRLYQKAGGEQQDKDNPRIYQKEYATKLRGSNLLAKNLPKPTPDELVLGFLRTHVKDLETEWRDRKSRLQ